MYTLLRRIGLHEAVKSEAPSLLVSLLVAEVLYKFHSFLLEAAAFLATWYSLSWVHQRLRSTARRTQGKA